MIELHDVRIFAAEKMEDAYDAIRRSWWGTPQSLHLDCWGELVSADGHDIYLKDKPSAGEDKLFFVNLGGYDPADFTELHKNVVVVAPNESKAKVRALKAILDWKSHHKDYMYEVENIFCLDAAAAEKKLFIHLEKTDSPRPFIFTCGYKPLGKKVA